MLMLRTLTVACTIAALPLTASYAQTASPPSPAAAAFEPKVGQAGKDVIWVPTAQELVDRMLEMGEVTADDYVVDLGSGDGRTVISVAKLGARGHGIEYNPDMVALSKRNAEAAGVTDRATFAQADIFESDFSDADVITLFLLPDLNLRLRPTLLDMKPGTRVVSNSFNMGDWTPDQSVEATGECSSWCRAYKWVIPAKVAGEWNLGDDQLELTQTYQMLQGSLTRDGESHQISDAKMEGRAISFTAGGTRYTGEVAEDNTMTIAAEGGERLNATRSAG
jgi:SAM-dependent methyltransferase